MMIRRWRNIKILVPLVRGLKAILPKFYRTVPQLFSKQFSIVLKVSWLVRQIDPNSYPIVLLFYRGVPPLSSNFFSSVLSQFPKSFYQNSFNPFVSHRSPIVLKFSRILHQAVLKSSPIVSRFHSIV